MKTFVQTGNILTLTAPSGGVTGGVPAKVGSIVAVPVNSADAGEPFEGQVVGVHNLVKASGKPWAEGDAIYWDDAAKNCTKTATNNTKIGVAVYTAGSADVEGFVRLSAAF